MPLNYSNDEEQVSNVNSYHLAGIVPVSGQPLDFGLPWHDCLQPIAKNFLAIERSILECATAGCETIWVVCDSDMQPLIKHRIGEMVEDPAWVGRKYDQYPSESRKAIPIYYVEIHPKDQGKKESLVWSIIYGGKIAKKVCGQISKWVEPDKYYVAFPYAVYPSQHIRKWRETISKPGNFFLTTSLGNSVMNNEYIGFAFDANLLTGFSQLYWKKATGLFDPEGKKRDGKYPTERLPVEKRYSGRFFSLSDIFSSIDTSKPTTWVEMDWYYDISSWDNYINYLSSEESKKIKKPSKSMMRYRTWNKIGEPEISNE
jgi:hypothetical protein